MACRTDRLKESIRIAAARLTDDLRRTRTALIASAGSLLLLQLLFGAICPLRIFLGIPCPGCGLTRAVSLLFAGNLSASVAMHPLAIPALVWLIGFPMFRYFLPKHLLFWKIYGMLWVASALIVYLIGMLTRFPDTEPYCLYEGILRPLLTQLFS